VSNDSNIELIKLVRITGMREAELASLKAAGGSGWNRVMQTVANHEALLSKGMRQMAETWTSVSTHLSFTVEFGCRLYIGAGFIRGMNPMG